MSLPTALPRARAFSTRWRRAGVVYVVVTLPVVTLVGGLAHSENAYRTAFVLLASGVYTTPALVVTWLATRRAPPIDRWLWVLWFLALVLIYTSGFGILLGRATGWSWGNGLGIALVVTIALLLSLAVVGMVRSRSGCLAMSVDIADCVSSLVLLTAPAILLWGESVVGSDDAWFTIPAGFSAIGMVSGVFWVVVLFIRLGPERGAHESIGVALALLGLVNAVAQTAQGLSGFTLPSAPLLALHGACMSLMLLVPLHLPARAATGLDRLPPQAQVRGGGMAVGLMLGGLPVLLVVTAAVRDRHAWATTFSLGIVTTLLVLAALRQGAAVRETTRLYARVERASEERRDLLARVIQRIDDDRHAVAAQLHEQAMSAYVMFVSLMQATARSPVRDDPPAAAAHQASALLRDDLARQAEALRQLMVAVRPLSVDQPEEDGITASIRAYLHSLYGDQVTPRLDVSIDADLVLDWIKETIVLRIVQEALRNVWRHSAATQVSVRLRASGNVPEIEIEDDGVGFDPTASLFESGIAVMRSFAGFAGGSLELVSAPGTGTLVSARLGEGAPGGSEPEPPAARLSRVPALRLVRDRGT